MKKVLFTSVDLNIGGVQKTLVSIINNFDFTKYQVDIMLLKRSDDKLGEFLPKDVHLLYLEDYIKIKEIHKLIYRLKKNISITSILKMYQNKLPLSYDVAIAFNGFNNYADLIVPMIKAKKRIIWVHNDFYHVVKYSRFPFLYRQMYQQMGKKFQYFDNIVVVCEEVADTFNLLYNHQYHDKIKVIYNYLDVSEILKKAKMKASCKLEGNFKIVTTGRLCKAKNFDLLVRLHQKLIANHYDVTTYIIGDGEQRTHLEEQIKAHNVEENFKLLGKQLNPYSIMKEADLFISTSLYESFANTIIESLILQIPVIATNTAGARNIRNNIANKKNIAIGKNEEELYKLIVEYLNQPCTIEGLDYNKYNKKVMLAIYDLLS